MRRLDAREQQLQRGHIELAIGAPAPIADEPSPLQALGPEAEAGPVEVQCLGVIALTIDEDEQMARQRVLSQSTLGQRDQTREGFGARPRARRQQRRSVAGYRASYLIKRLRTHGLIKKVAHTYKYFFTKLGRRVVVTALVIRKYFVQPSLVRAAL